MLDSFWTGAQFAHVHWFYNDHVFDYLYHLRHARAALGRSYSLCTIPLQSLYSLRLEPLMAWQNVIPLCSPIPTGVEHLQRAHYVCSN